MSAAAPPNVADRVQEYTGTLGTGPITCIGPAQGYRTVASAHPTGSSFPYTMLSGNGIDWETGLGTVTGSLAGEATVSRNPLASSQGGGLISLVGISTIFCDMPAALLSGPVTVNVQAWGIKGDGNGQGAGTSNATQLQAVVDAFPSGTPIHLHFQKNAGQLRTYYVVDQPVRSNGRLVRATFDDGADIDCTSGAGYLAFDLIEVFQGDRHFTQTGFANGYAGASGAPQSMNPSYGRETRLINYSGSTSTGSVGGPNRIQSNTVITDTRYAASDGQGGGNPAGGQLALGEQIVISTPNLLDGTSPALGWHIMLGQVASEMGVEWSNHIAPLGPYLEVDLNTGTPVFAVTDQAAYMTAGGGLLFAAGGGENAQPWNSYIAGDIAYALRTVGGGTGATYSEPPTLSAKWPFYPAIFGATNPSATTAGQTITIDDGVNAPYNVVVFSSTGSLAEVAGLINTASGLQTVPNIVGAQVGMTGSSSPLPRLVIYSKYWIDSLAGITLSNASGTPLATLGISAGSYSNHTGSYAVAISGPHALSGSIVSSSSQIVVNGHDVTLNGGAGTGSLADIAASINTANVTGITATISSYGNGATTGRLVVLGFIAQMPASGGMTLANSTNSPLNTLSILASTYYAPAPPHAWAEATSETVGNGAVFATGDAFSLGYSTDTANTTEIGPITVTVGTGGNGLVDAALAINEAAIAASWSVSTTFAQNAAQGTPFLFVAGIAGLHVGMAAYDPAHTSGQSPAYLPPNSVILAIDPVADTGGGYQVTLSGGVQSAQSAGASIVFGLVKASVVNAADSGAALHIRNMAGGSLFLAEGTGKPLWKLGIQAGTYFPGCLPPRLQQPIVIGYNSVAAGGVAIRAAGQRPELSTDTVTAPRSVLRIAGQWRHGIEMHEATFDTGIALRLARGQEIVYGDPVNGSDTLAVATAGTLAFNGQTVLTAGGTLTNEVLVTPTLTTPLVGDGNLHFTANAQGFIGFAGTNGTLVSGVNLSLTAGPAGAGPDVPGGNLVLSGGTANGAGGSAVVIEGASVVATSGSTATAPGVIATFGYPNQTIGVATGTLTLHGTIALDNSATVASAGTVTLSGTYAAATQAAGDNSTNLATTAYVYQATTQVATQSVATPGTITLTEAQYVCPIIALTGTLSGNVTIIVPNSGTWQFASAVPASGSTVTVKTSGGTGIAVGNSYNTSVSANGTNVVGVNSIMGGLISGGFLAGAITSNGTISGGSYTGQTNRTAPGNSSATHVTLATAGTVTLTAGQAWLDIKNAASIATGSIVIPAGYLEGAMLRVSTRQAIGTVTITAAGGTIVGGPTTLAAGASWIAQFSSADSTWI